MNIKSILSVVALVLVVAWGSALRLEGLSRQSLWIDEAVFVLQSQGIYQSGMPLMPNGNVDWNSSVATYLISLGHFLFRDIHIAGRLAPALAGILSIVAVYWIAKLLGKSRIAGLLCAMLCAFSATNIAWARQADAYIFIQLFFLLTVLSAVAHSSTRSWLFYITSLVCAMLSVGCHAGGYVAAMFVAIYTTGVVLSRIWPLLKRSRQTLASDKSIPDVKGPRTARFVLWSFVFIVCVFLALLLWKSHMGHSSPVAVLSMLENPFNTDYCRQYFAFLFKGAGLLFLLMAIIGAAYVVRMNFNVGVALLLSAGCYFYLISRVIWTYGERYAFPLEAVVWMLLCIGTAVTASIIIDLMRMQGKRRAALCSMFAMVICIVSAGRCDFRFKPGGEYWLGFTAPQPDWRKAFEYIEADASARGMSLVTISPYPLMHDLYIGRSLGAKYYLPISFGGHPDGVSWTAGHTTSIPLRSLSAVKQVEGYMLLDDMAIRMLGVDGLKGYIEANKPVCVIPGRYKIYIWRLSSAI